MIWGWQMYKCMLCTQYACLMSLFWRLLVLRSVVQVAVLCLFCVTMVSTSVVFWTVNSKSLLQFLFLLSQFHRVHKVIDASQGPHWRWEPGLYISVLTHHQHAEVVTVYLQLISETLHHILWKRLLLRLTFPCRLWSIFHSHSIIFDVTALCITCKKWGKRKKWDLKSHHSMEKTPLFLKLSIQYPQSSTRQNDEYLSMWIQF